MTAAGRLVLLVTSPRVPVGLLSAPAWAAVTAGPVFCRASSERVLAALADGGVSIWAVAADRAAAELVGEVVAAARSHPTVTWWVDGDVGTDAVAQALIQAAAVEPGIAVEEVLGSWDLPGARMLDVVTTMDRLRSPGGCPWDAKQTHETLAPYLLEEAYEAFQAIEDADSGALREELGDVLLQIAFHARLAEERPAGERWTIDDVASGLVDKLVRRHPHVFGGVTVADADEVNANWEAIKAAERDGGSALASVPLAAAALTLAATLQRKASRAGLTDLGAGQLDQELARFESGPSPEAAGQLLWSAVAAMAGAGIDAEAALRSRAREFRDDANRTNALGGTDRR